MIITIRRLGENIEVCKDYRNIKDSGEIAHILCEVRLIEEELLELWEEFKE